MLKLDHSGSERLLLMDGLNWVIKSSLKTEHKFLKSDDSGQICPAHPSNLTSGNPNLPLNSWRFNKMGEGQREILEDGHVIVRCSTHDAEHARWVVEQARLGELDKEKVGAFLCEPDYDGRAFLLSLLDAEIQKEVSPWNKNKTLEVVPFLDEGDFLPWLYQEAADGRWTIISYVLFDNISSAILSFTRTEKQTPSQGGKRKACLLLSPKRRWLAERSLFLGGRNVRRKIDYSSYKCD